VFHYNNTAPISKVGWQSYLEGNSCGHVLHSSVLREYQACKVTLRSRKRVAYKKIGYGR